MPQYCFAIPALQPEPAQSELNAFLARERVVALRREFVADGANSYWAFCVEVAAGQPPLPAALKVAGSRHVAGRAAPEAAATSKLDYKQLLSEADFAVFAALRELRKQLAQAEGVPVYAVFTNEQLAELATQRPASLAALGAVEGIGPSRLGKYGAAVLACLQGTGGGARAEQPATLAEA
jgi:superfamily II DNA helicase RecQ